MKFYTRFNPPPSKARCVCNTKSLTRQEFKEEADINNIVKRYEQTGWLVDPSKPGTVKPQFGDFSELPTRQQMYDKMIEARDAFDSLPVDIRRRFDWSPAVLLDFLSDEKNRPEAIRLGLITNDVKTISKETKDTVDDKAEKEA